MRKFLITASVLAAATQVGCFVPIYSSSPDDRARELIYQSAKEQLRHIPQTSAGADLPPLGYA